MHVVSLLVFPNISVLRLHSIDPNIPILGGISPAIEGDLQWEYGFGVRGEGGEREGK